MTNNWQSISLGDVCKPLKGLTYKSEDYSNEQEGQIFITLKCIAKGGGFNKEGIKFIKKSNNRTEILESGDLIIANTDLTRAGDVIGAPLFVPQINGDDEYVYSMDISKLDLDRTKIDQKYLYQYLLTDSVRNYMRSISSGSTVLHLKVSLIDKLKLPLPNMETQMKISDVLSSIDEAIQKTDQIIHKSGVLKNGLMNSLLVKGIGHKKFRQTKLGDIPDNWKVTSILDADIQIIDGDRGINYPKQNEFFDEGFCLFLSNKNIKNDTFEFSDTSFISEEKDRLLRKGKLSRWDVILTTRGTVGNVAIYDNSIPFDHIRINSGMLIFRAGLTIKPEFFYFLLRSPQFKERYKQLGSGSAQPQLPIGSLRNLLIPEPPMSEQEEIVELLKTVESKYNAEVKQLDSLLNLKKGLMHDIFNQKVQIN